jgi:hypothetical protein
LTRHRQVAISLAGFANDPANLLLSSQGSFRPAPHLADGKRVCSNLFEEGKSLKMASRARRTVGPRQASVVRGKADMTATGSAC